VHIRHKEKGGKRKDEIEKDMEIPNTQTFGNLKLEGGKRKEGIGKDMGISDSRVYMGLKKRKVERWIVQLRCMRSRELKNIRQELEKAWKISDKKRKASLRFEYPEN
jgi:hypothetical protein